SVTPEHALRGPLLNPKGAVPLDDELFEHLHIALRRVDDAIAGAAHQSEPSARRTVRRNDRVEARFATRPHDLVDAGDLDLQRRALQHAPPDIRPLDAQARG